MLSGMLANIIVLGLVGHKISAFRNLSKLDMTLFSGSGMHTIG
jgi:hypothetical protein